MERNVQVAGTTQEIQRYHFSLWVRLAPNWTNLGLFRVEPNVPFGVNLTHFEAKSNISAEMRHIVEK